MNSFFNFIQRFEFEQMKYLGLTDEDSELYISQIKFDKKERYDPNLSVKVPFYGNRYDVDIYSDERGDIAFSNDSSLEKFSRFYFIEHKCTEVVRAWQGHPLERKMFVPITGKFILAWVKIDDQEHYILIEIV